MSRRRTAVAVALLAIVSACSSTSKPSPTAGATAEASSAPSVAASAKPGAPAASAAPRVSSAPSGGGGGGAGPSFAPAPPGRVSQGVTPTEIKIGLSTSADFSAAATAFGLNQSSNSNADQSKGQAVVDYINKHGGVAHRKVVPVFHDISSFGTFDEEATSACSDWTEDHKVFAVLAWLYDRDSLVSCLAKHNTVLLKSSYQVMTNQLANKYRNFYYMPDHLFGDNWRVYIDGLVAQKFMNKTNKVGLIRLDNPEHKFTADKILKPALKRYGITLAQEAAITPFNNAGEAAGQTNAQLSNTVLRFRAAGVDRVIYIDIGNVLMWFFGIQAESQGYRPLHGMTSYNIPAYIQDNVSAQQLHGAVGVGWWPDIDESGTTGNQPGEQTCEGIMRAAKLGVDGTGLNFCSRLFLLQAALDHETDVTPASLRRGMDKLGRSFSSALTPMTYYRPGHFDGVGGVRYFHYVESCGCFKYYGPWRKILG